MNRMLKMMPPIILTLMLLVTGCQPLSEPLEEVTITTPEETESATPEETELTTEEEETSPTTEEEEETTTPPPPVGTQIGNLAPDFTLQDLNGETVTLSGLRGSPVMLNFWATWCGPCVHEMPFLQEIYEEWSDQGLVLMTIDLREDSGTVRSFLRSNGYSFPVLLDITGVVAEKYGIRGIPTTFFIDKDGIIQEMRVGSFPSKEAIEEYVRQIVP